ncbi:MAG: ABC transporter ATP-binding protein [Acidimicrobiales bacterium]
MSGKHQAGRESRAKPSAMAPSKQGPTWSRATALFSGRKWLVISLVLASLLAGLCESTVLALVATAAGALVSGHSKVAFGVGPLEIVARVDTLLAAGMVAALVRLALQVVLSYLPSRISADVQASMRLRLFSSFRRASWAIQATDGEGAFQELATSQVLQATSASISVTTAISSGVLLLVLVTSAIFVGLTTALVVIAAALGLFFLLRPLNKVSRRYARALSAAQVGYARGIHDSVNVAEETQVFGVGGAQETQLGVLVEAARRRFFSTQFIGRLVPGTYQAIVLLLLVVGLSVVDATGAGHLSSLAAVILLLVRASSYGQQLQSGIQSVHSSLPFLERLDEAGQKYDCSPVTRGAGVLETMPPIAFDNVSYSYHAGTPVLRGVSFRVEPGEAIGVVGPSGAGKSTLVQLLLGLRVPECGTYSVGDVPAEHWTFESWTRAFAYVPQEPRLLQGTVTENIAFLREIEEAAVTQAARFAHVDGEIATWVNGYDTLVSQRANAVSGGQRQRLCLARALAGDPFVLILDEPTSALDARSEALVQQSLAAIKGRLTLIVVAHRLSTLDLCDRVMVMRDGVIDAFAPAAELLKTNDFYRKASSLSDSNIFEEIAQ